MVRETVRGRVGVRVRMTLRSRVGLGLVLQCSPHPRSVLQGATHPAPTGRGTPSTRAPSRCSSAVYSSRFSLSRYTASSSKLALGNVRNLARQNLVAPLKAVQERGGWRRGCPRSPLDQHRPHMPERLAQTEPDATSVCEQSAVCTRREM